MIWQDFVITVANVFLIYALIPQIYKNSQEKRKNVSLQTSLITSVGLYVISITMFTLKLYASFATVFVSAVLWSVLLFQSVKHRE